MKKLFLFATVAAAGLFAGCSSSDDAIADAGGSPIENVDGDKAAIKIGIGNMVNTATRGTGTVGGVGDGSSVANVWAGQRINVFMFKQITAANQTLTLATEKDANNDDVSIYENTVMITPGSPENLITSPNNESTDDDGSGEAMIEDGSIKYYPSTGNFDFFGYHADDAVTGAVASEGEAAALKMYVPFKIDGSQDLMSAKAELTGTLDTSVNPVTGTGQKKTMYDAGTHAEDYYSAYSARKQVQPALTFDHLLTRLAFKVKPGNKEAAGFGQNYIINSVDNPTIDADTYNSLSTTDQALFEEVTPATDPVTYKFIDAPTTDSYKNYSVAVQALLTVTTSDGQDATRAVMVKEIKVKSKNTGKLYVAWTALDNSMDLHSKIAWGTEDPVWLSLQERPHAKLKAGMTITAGTDYDAADEPAVVTAWKDEIATLDPTDDADKIAALQAKIAKFWSSVSEDVYNILSDNASVGKEKYDVLTNTNRANANLVALNPVAAQAKDGTTYANYGTTEAYGAKEVSVGEALLVAPNAWDAEANNGAGAYTAENLEMEVTVSQLVPTNWNYPTKLESKEMKYTLPVPYTTFDANKAGSGAFMANFSYNVILTVYGYNRIEVHTVVSAWNAGGNRNVGGDDDPATEWEEWTETNNQNP